MKTRFFIYEAYKDEEAVLAHKKTPHYLACVDKLEELMSEPRKKRSFVGCCRSDKLTGSQRFNGIVVKEAKNNGCYTLAPVVFYFIYPQR
ncbi:antibiotic biosynthesis monooxygenase [Enterobacter cloacae]|uniref:Antibiotic biosynthesis monooxygenase n=1 Tax=Enterobacter cloacae TaxID=550 RepID=A0A377LSW0_ENTCL|nr:antibiotic biosynthesis monooxygenase [Enterobacter cloacae]